MSDEGDHRDFLKALSDEDRAALTRRSNKDGLRHLFLHLLLLGVLLLPIVLKLPFWPVFLLPAGVVMIFLFTLQHETVHDTAFASSRVNLLLTRAIGFLLFNPPLWFRYFHLAHHRHTQDPVHDPELAGDKPESWSSYLLHVSGLPLWWSQAKTIVGNAAGRVNQPYIPTKARGRLANEARLMIAVYLGVTLISMATASYIALTCWIAPLFLGQPFLRLYLLAEHGRCPMVADMLENTRTTYTNRIVRFLAWNMPYHAEHHTMPTVPFHQLPRLNRLIRDRLKSTSEGYVEFHGEYVRGYGRCIERQNIF